MTRTTPRWCYGGFAASNHAVARAESASALPHTRAWWRDASGVACWVSALAVVYLWLAGGGAQGLFSSSSELFTSLGRVTGLLAADLLLIQVFLMARVPWVERSYGQDELARRHRLVGFWSFNLMLGHIALITLGYALADHRGVVPELWHVVTTYPGMLLASIATASLVLVAVTSIRLARRRLQYESWHLLHLYAYLGVGLSIPHQLWTGADFTSSPAARVYWVTAYAVAAGAIVAFRIGLPVWRSLRHGLVVSGVDREGEGVVSVRFRGRALHRMPARPGQFFVWRFLDGKGWGAGNPYSLSAAPGEELRVTVKELGEGSGRLATLPTGTKVLVEGPYGRLTAEQRVADRVVLVGCGIGITPLRAILEDLEGVPTTLLYRARSEADLVLRDEIEVLAAQRGVAVHYLLGPRLPGSWLPAAAAGHRDADVLQRLAPDLAKSDVYVCGPDAWADAVVAAARASGVPKEQVHQERFAW
jgi:predicted ferric reductase